MGDPLPASEIWWQLLCRKIDLSRHSIPRDLSGLVRIEVRAADGAVALFHLELSGPSSACKKGRPEHWDALVETTEAELSHVLFAERTPRNALRVHGDARLFVELLEVLSKCRPQSPLSIQGGMYENDAHRRK